MTRATSIAPSFLMTISLLCLGASSCGQARNVTPESSISIQANSARTSDQVQSAPATNVPSRSPDVVYVPTPMPVVNEMLRLANVQSTDRVYDLGSGDGRIVIAAAQQFGARGTGIDIDPDRIKEANENAQKAGVTELVDFRQQDLFETDFRDATVVTLYLLPRLNLQLRPKLLRELKPGTRIVSHQFDMGEWKPEQVVKIGDRTVYYWIVPDNPPANLK